MEIPSKIFFLNILDSSPTLQRPNLGWQQDWPERKEWVKLSHSKSSLEEHSLTDPAQRPRRSTKTHFGAGPCGLFGPYVTKLQTCISGVSKLWSSQVHPLSQPHTPQTSSANRNSLKYECSQYSRGQAQYDDRKDEPDINDL